MDIINELIQKMILYYTGDPKRIQHFLKVHSFARLIGESEGLNSRTQLILEAAAAVHDIGIKPAEELYGRCGGKLQEKLGPAPARKMLEEIGFEAEITDRVCFLVAHHHTYTDVQGADYQILIEADFLVNLYEDGADLDAVKAALKSIFRTHTGTRICREMFLGAE